MSGGDRRRSEVLVYAGGVIALAICCGAPLLIAALAFSGLGGWFLSNGALVLGALALGAGAVVIALVTIRALRTHRALTRSRRAPPLKEVSRP